MRLPEPYVTCAKLSQQFTDYSFPVDEFPPLRLTGGGSVAPRVDLTSASALDATKMSLILDEVMLVEVEPERSLWLHNGGVEEGLQVMML